MFNIINYHSSKITWINHARIFVSLIKEFFNGFEIYEISKINLVSTNNRIFNGEEEYFKYNGMKLRDEERKKIL